MAGNRLKTTHTIQFRKIWKLVLLCVVVTVFAVVYVFQQVNIHRVANEIEALEENLAQIQQRNAVLMLQIEKQQSPEELQHKVAYYGLRMVEMSDPSVQVVEARTQGYALLADRRSSP